MMELEGYYSVSDSVEVLWAETLGIRGENCCTSAVPDRFIRARSCWSRASINETFIRTRCCRWTSACNSYRDQDFSLFRQLGKKNVLRMLEDDVAYALTTQTIVLMLG